MGNERHNDNVMNESEYNVNDNDPDEGVIPQYYAEKFLEFLVDGYKECSNLQFLVLSCIKLQKFMYKWQVELNEKERKYLAQSISYKEYLASPYWNLVATIYKCRKNFKCERCGQERSSNLSLHHKTYEHIGSELQYPEDMEVICAQCHMKEHNIKEVENV